MTVLDELIAEALDTLERPDLQSVARTLVKRAIYAVHGAQDFDRDLVVLDTPIAVGQMSAVVPIPALFRKENYLATFDVQGGLLCQNFRRRSREQLTDYFGFQQKDVFHIVGNSLDVQFAREPALLRLEYWAYPTFTRTLDGGGNTTSVDSSSWILTNNDRAIFYYLLSFLSDHMQKNEDYQRFETRAMQAVLELKANTGDN